MKISARPTGFTSKEWRVERDGQHLADVHLSIIHATGLGKYMITGPDRPGEVWAPLYRLGTFSFDVWDRATALDVLRKVIVRYIAPDSDLDVTFA
jgi:hypothetical protein